MPDALILEGSWWQAERNRQRLAHLHAVRETRLPQIYWGRYRSLAVIYSCVYGAPRAIEPIHIFGSICRPLVIQIGSCGSLSADLPSGDILIPTSAHIGEGASQYYVADDLSQSEQLDSQPEPRLVAAAERLCVEQGLQAHCGRLLTTSALFAQPDERIARWHDEGYLGVDMETSAVYSVARYFGLSAIAVLFSWDELLHGRSFFDSFSPQEQARLDRANEAIFEIALALALQEANR